MATMHQLSNMLTSFDESYTNFTNVKSAQNEVSNAINDATNQLDSAINGYTVAANDEQNNNIIAGVTLVKNACTALKSHVDGDISSLLSHGAEVKETIDEIKTRIKQGEGLEEKKLKQKADLANGIKDDVYEENQQVIKLNKEIDILNEKGEAQLQAMSNAINGVAFGIKGNMKKGGALGVSVNYGDNYKFNPADYALPQDNGEQNPSDENPVGATKQLNILQGLGCGVVGAVESVGKVAEGIVDFGGTVVSGVSSLLGTVTGWLGWNGGQRFFSGVSDSISGFVKNELVGGAIGGLVDLTSGITGVTKNDYNASTGKAIGSTVGNVVAHGALWATPGGALLSAASIGGTSSESSLQSGDAIGLAALKGVGMGGISFAGGKLLGAVTSKIAPSISNWAQTSSNIFARGYRAAATPFGAGWGSKSLGTKVMSIVASPVRGAIKGIGRMIQGGSKVAAGVVNHVPFSGAIKAADNAASTFAQGLVDRATPRVASVFSRQKVNNYNTARTAWQSSGSQVNTPEYTAMQNEWNRLPADMKNGLNMGDQVLTPAQTDSLVNTYNNTVATYRGTPNATNQAAMDAAYNQLPASARPTASGDVAFTTHQKNVIGNQYKLARQAWQNAGGNNSGPEYTAMQTYWNRLPADMKNGVTIGHDVLTPAQTDSLVNSYNTTVATYRGTPNATNQAAMDTAYNQLPASVKPATSGDVALNIAGRNAVGASYNSSATSWNTAGRQVNTAEYTAAKSAYDSLNNFVKPPTMGDAIGTPNASTFGTSGQRTGGILSGLIDENTNR